MAPGSLRNLNVGEEAKKPRLKKAHGMTHYSDDFSLLEQVCAATVSWTITTRYVAAACVLLVEEKTARISTRVVGALAVPIAA